MIPVRDNHPVRRSPVLTRAFILACVLVFVYQVLLPTRLLEGFVVTWGLTPARFRMAIVAPGRVDGARTVASLFTSMFLHGHWLHLLGNVWILWVFGPAVEDRLGHLRFAWFYVTTGVAAGLVHALLHLGSRTPMVGASGAIAGVMAAYLVFYPWRRVTFLVPVFFLPLFVPLPAAAFLVFWFAYQLLGAYTSGFGQTGGIAFWAHVGGFVTGIWLVRRWRTSTS